MPSVQELIKHVLDRLCAVLSIILLSPVLLLLAILIKLDSSGPVLFVQERVGKDGTIFKSIKFRTMICRSIEKGLGLNIKNDD